MTDRPHWYFVSVWFCVLCGLTQTTRERRYTPRPADPAARHDYMESACGCHFC